MGCLFTLGKWYVKLIIILTIIFITIHVSAVLPVVAALYVGYYAWKFYLVPIKDQTEERRIYRRNGGYFVADIYDEKSRRTIKDVKYQPGKYIRKDYTEEFRQWTACLVYFIMITIVACAIGIASCKTFILHGGKRDIASSDRDYTPAGKELMEKRREAYFALDEKTHLATLDEKISRAVIRGRKDFNWRLVYFLMNSNLGERTAGAIREMRREALERRGAEGGE